MMQKFLLLALLLQNLSANKHFYYNENKKRALTPLHAMARGESNIDYYEDENKRVLGVTKRLLVKLTESRYLQKIMDEFNLTMQKKVANNLYLLQTKDKKLTLEVSQKLTEKEFVEYAHPDFIKKTLKR